MKRALHLLAIVLSMFVSACALEPASEEDTLDDELAAAPATLYWSPGYYALVTNAAARDRFLSSPHVAAFAGIQVTYAWADFEGAAGNYSAGFARLDADLAAAHAAHKKLILQLQYKAFGTAHAVPAYMRGAGPWCVQTATHGRVCGEYAMGNGASAMIWQGRGTGGVADRLNAWISAVGAHVMTGPYATSVVGVVLPESAIAVGAIPLADVGFTQPRYRDAIEASLVRAVAALPHASVIQYINFFPPTAAGPYLTELADFALAHPHVGLGCPDLGSVSTFHPPGYAVLKSATYHGRLPIAPAVQAPDFAAARSTGLAATWHAGVDHSPNGMQAQIITWAFNGDGVFTFPDAAAFLAQHPMPNVAAPTW